MTWEISSTESCIAATARWELRSQLQRGVFALILFCVCCLLILERSLGLGGMSSIAASYGEDDPVFCAIEATSEQQVFCWGRNTSLESPTAGPSLVGLSGGLGFMCGIKAISQHPFCWEKNVTSINIVPDRFQNTSYSSIAAGDGHVCASRSDSGLVDCWNGDQFMVPPEGALLQSVVAGRRFVCGMENANGTARCWGDASFGATEPPSGVRFESLSAGGQSACGIVRGSREIVCWGDNRFGQTDSPKAAAFVLISMGLFHGCAIRQDTHGVVCWGDQFNNTLTPEIEFLALSSSRGVTCGVKEDNLLVVCWGNGTEFTPPLQLSSPGVCRAVPCGRDEFSYNASRLGVVTAGLCAVNTEEVCAPCASHCLNGSFVSSPCKANDNRQCTDCSLCQNSSCSALCKITPAPLLAPIPSPKKHRAMNLAAVLGAAISGGLFVAAIGWALLFCLPRRERWLVWSNSSRRRSEPNHHHQASSHSLQNGNGNALQPTLSGGMVGGVSAPPKPAEAALRFRLTELRDATNGFKEVNELGRGSYGFVYKAMLSDGRLVAVKRANAARRIHGSSRDFDTELEVLSKLRHGNIVNLVGYCGELGERLLVYEFMPHGTLHDHLFGGLSPLNWGQRLRIAAQAAKGLEYLHNRASPQVIHRDIKSSNILLDGDWAARVADFGLAQQCTAEADAGYLDPTAQSAAAKFSEKGDVYGFGVVLLEILSGRKAFDAEFDPPRVVDWAGPLIRQGRTVADVVDRTVEMARNPERLIKLGEISEKCVRSTAEERPSMSEVAAWLEQIAQGSGAL